MLDGLDMSVICVGTARAFNEYVRTVIFFSHTHAHLTCLHAHFRTSVHARVGLSKPGRTTKVGGMFSETANHMAIKFGYRSVRQVEEMGRIHAIRTRHVKAVRGLKEYLQVKV